MNPLLSSSTTQNVIGGVAISATGVATVIATVRAQFPGVPLWPESMDLFIGGLIVALLGALASRWIALTRDPDKKPGGDKSNTSALPCIAFFLCASLALSGCMGMAPAVMGKTHYNVEFTDQTADQNTQYKMDIKAPAGVDLATVTGMTYDWRPDGSGAINVSQQGNVDTKGQAAMITEVSRQQLEAINMVLNALAPVIGQKIQSDDNQARIEAEVSAQEMQAAIALIEEMNRKNAGR